MITNLSQQDLTVFNREHWAAEMQLTYFKENVARAVCSEELRDVLVDGTKVNRPYRKALRDTSYTKGTSISSWNQLGGTNEWLDVDTVRIVPSYVDDLDELQNKWDIAMITARDSQKVLNNRIDQKVFSNYPFAHSFISAQDLGGSGTGSFGINVSNVMNMFTVAGRNLDKWNRGQISRFALIGPRLKEILKLAVSGRETTFGDSVGANGIVGPRYGFDCYLSNNIPFTAVITESGQPTAGQFFYVDGVAFKWVTTGTAAAAGDVSLGGNAAASYANLVLAINGTGTPGVSTYIEISDDDREALINGDITAVYGTTVLTVSGYGDVVVSIGNTGNATLTSNTQYPIFGVKGAIDLIVQKEPNVEFRVCENLLGRKIYAWTTYGTKVFTKEKKSLCCARIDTSAWV